MEMKILAQELGISHQMANRYRRRGMPNDSLEAAQTWIKSNINPFRSKTGRIGGNSGMKQVSTETAEVSSDMALLLHEVNNTQLDLETKDADVLFKNARALKEKAVALQQAAEHQKFIGELVLKADVEKVIFERGRQFRDGVMACSSRIAPDVIGKESIQEIETIINREMRSMLEQFAKLPIIEN